jgi:hypothetical protein
MKDNIVANMTKFRSTVLIFVLFLSSCAKAQALPPLVVTALPAEPLATETSIPPTTTPLPTTNTLAPAPTQNASVFGSIGTGELQAGVLESVVNAIFKKTMDGFVAAGSVQEYQVASVSVFPGSNGLITEVIFNVKTNDSTWLADGGTPSADGWINNSCSRFDFVTTDTEYQLKNRRLCG